MGSNCIVVLPSNVRIEDVSKVIGIAVGFKPKYIKFRDNTNTGYIGVDGVKMKSTSVPYMVDILFDDRYVSYFFENSDNPDSRLFYPTSTSFWIAVSKRLVDFFGGTIDFNDCDSVEVDYSVEAKSNDENCPTSGELWEDFQQRMFNVKPIHISEMDNDKAAYKNDSYQYNFDEEGFMIR